MFSVRRLRGRLMHLFDMLRSTMLCIHARLPCGIAVSCSTCKNDRAYYTEVQTRSADEAATLFYTCTKCGWVVLIASRWSHPNL